MIAHRRTDHVSGIPSTSEDLCQASFVFYPQDCMAGRATQIRIDHQYPHPHLGQDSRGIDRCNCLAFAPHPARKQERFRRGFSLRQQEGSAQHPVGFGSDGERMWVSTNAAWAAEPLRS